MRIRKSELQQLAKETVSKMGDVFWDAHTFPENGQFVDPEAVATNEITATLAALAERLGASVVRDRRAIRTRRRG